MVLSDEKQGVKGIGGKDSAQLLRRSLADIAPAAWDGQTLERYARSTSCTQTRPAAVVWPVTTEQIQAIVRLAASLGVPVYPISRGKNWGYGDAAAATDGQIIVDLSQMNQIVHLNRDLAYVVVQPGVSQGQLYDYLQREAPELWMDATGAGPDASLVGNSLERGFGHTPYGDHSLNTCGMEVVLADGRVLQTGFGHYPQAKAQHVYRYGVGPFLDGLFAQSNLGIVTQMGIWLMPRPKAFSAFFVKVAEESALPDIIDRLGKLRRSGLLTSAIHIANDVRVLSGRMRYPFKAAEGRTPLPELVRKQLRRSQGIGPWNAAGGIYGTHGTVKATKRELRRALRGYSVKFVDDRLMSIAERIQRILSSLGLGARLKEQLATLKPIYQLMKGEPVADPLSGVLWALREPPNPSGSEPIDPLDTQAGLMWICPVLPNEGHAAVEVMQLIKPIYASYGFDLLVTFTMINERAMICVSNIAFDKSLPDHVHRAECCYTELYESLIHNGYIPYRAGHCGQAILCNHDSSLREVTERIKNALDPQGVIAPGRYQPGPGRVGGS